MILKKILTNKNEFPNRAANGFAVQKFVPKGLIGLEAGDIWKLHRRLLTPILTNKLSLESSIGVLNEKAEQLCKIIGENCGDRDLDINPILTINLVIQPIIIQNMSSKKAYIGKGLLERFLYCIPKSKLGYRTHDKAPVSQSIKLSYNSKIQSLLSIDYNDTPRVLILNDEEAKLLLDLVAKHGKLEKACSGWIEKTGKSRSTFMRLLREIRKK